MRPIDAEKFEILSWKATDNQDYNDGFDDGVTFVMEKIDNAPTIDVMPVVHGHWIDNGDETVRCCWCATWFPKTRKSQLLFCGYCGAKMDE